MNWLVKWKRGSRESVEFGFRYLPQAQAKRDELNNMYQTDEYYVEAFMPEKVWK